jgi:hypothetical protein
MSLCSARTSWRVFSFLFICHADPSCRWWECYTKHFSRSHIRSGAAPQWSYTHLQLWTCFSRDVHNTPYMLISYWKGNIPSTIYDIGRYELFDCIGA